MDNRLLLPLLLGLDRDRERQRWMASVLVIDTDLKSAICQKEI